MIDFLRWRRIQVPTLINPKFPPKFPFFHEMEFEEVEAVLEKIWDLHDKLSDAIHSISRAHFLNTVKTLKRSDGNKKLSGDNREDNRSSGYVYVKDFGIYDEEIQEAKSLNLIRTALENLEDQLEFFQTVQIQQRAERDAAIARLEQSRIVLAMRLSTHQGKKHKVIEEALAFVGDVQDASHFISPENLFSSSENSGIHGGIKSNFLVRVLISSLNYAKSSLKLDHMGGIMGNAVMVAVTMVAILNLNRVSDKEHVELTRDDSLRKSSRLCSNTDQLDVLLGRG